jgi:hypothetical protein
MPINPSQPRSRLVPVLGSALALLVVAALGWSAYAQTEDSAGAKVVFTKMSINHGSLSFQLLNYLKKKPPTTFQTRDFTITNTGNDPLNPLSVTVVPPAGTGAADFILSGPTSPILLSAKSSVSFAVTYRPLTDGKVEAEIDVVSNATRGKQAENIKLTGNAKGPVPPTATATPTTTPTATVAPTITLTPTPTASPSASATPFPQGAGTTDRNSANAPAVIISGDLVTAYVPLGSDSFSPQGIAQVAIENGANPLPGPAVFSSGRANSCALANTGEIVCSQQDGTIDLVPAATATTTATNVATGATVGNDYFAGSCVGCGAMVDNGLGSTSAGLGIIATGNGFFTLDLSNIANAPTGPIVTNPAEPVGTDFGYDAANHRILNANYVVTNTSTNATTTPLFQIIDIANPASPLAYDLNDATGFFESNAQTCATDSFDAMLPETSAIDESTNIAYVSFHTPASCFATPPNAIALFDMSQANFTAGTAGASGTWDTNGKQVQLLTDLTLNGIDLISVESASHVAIIGGGAQTFGALQLPATSGSGTPAITDWVSANMPNDPAGNPWNGWSVPNGVATYLSPNTEKPIGLLLNTLESDGSRIGAGPYLALVDINALLALPRETAGGHQVAAANDGQALVNAGIVQFVPMQ